MTLVHIGEGHLFHPLANTDADPFWKQSRGYMQKCDFTQPSGESPSPVKLTEHISCHISLLLMMLIHLSVDINYDY